MTAPLRILLIEDDPGDAGLIEAYLRPARFAGQAPEIVVATSLNEARGLIVRAIPDLILLDLALPDSAGLATVTAVHGLTPGTPIVVLSGQRDAEFEADVLEAGAQDYLVKGEFDSELISRAIRHARTRARLEARLKSQDAEIRQLAFYDALTRLPNRRLLLDRLQQALAACGRNHRAGALLFIDLDNFKGLNDTLGHDVGDLLLIQVAQRLAQCVREGDTVSRLGGDEFVVMLEDLSGKLEDAVLQAEAVGEKIIAALNRPYSLNGNEQHSTPSIGITLFDTAHDNIDDLLKRADLAMYQAKEAGRNTLRFFDQAMQARVEARALLEAELRRGLRASQFLLHYQPQVDAAGRVTGAEALLRWNHPQRNQVAPDEFIALAEESGLIVSLGHWALVEACRQLKIWGLSPAHAHLTLAVNVSARQFRHPDFVDQVLAVIDHTGANPGRLKLELTESLLLDNVDATADKMTTLKTHGIGFALDDFGTGYSSLSYLKRLPLDQLKIDRSFVQDVLRQPNDAAIARAIIALGQSLGLPVIAEGVETPQQRDFLSSHGCVHFQGYLFGRPVPIADFPYGDQAGMA